MCHLSLQAVESLDQLELPLLLRLLVGALRDLQGDLVSGGGLETDNRMCVREGTVGGGMAGETVLPRTCWVMSGRGEGSRSEQGWARSQRGGAGS